VAAGGSSGEIIVWDDEAPPFVIAGQWQSPSASDFLVYATNPPGGPEIGSPAVAVSGVGSGSAVVVWGITIFSNLQPGVLDPGVSHLMGRRLSGPGSGSAAFQVDSGDPRPGSGDVASDRAGNVFVVWTSDVDWVSGADNHI